MNYIIVVSPLTKSEAGLQSFHNVGDDALSWQESTATTAHEKYTTENNAPTYQISAQYDHPWLSHFRGAPTRQCLSEVSGLKYTKFGHISHGMAELLTNRQIFMAQFWRGNFVPPISHRWRSNLDKIWGGDSSNIGASSAPFRFPICCFTVESQCLKLKWGKKFRPNFALFNPL